jgi:phage shock protein PspC (stress-responsive transcriptional regulator)
MQSNAREMRSYLLRAVLSVRKTVTALVPEGHPAREESIAAVGALVESLTLTPEQQRIKSLPEATPDLYFKPYRSSDEKNLLGICGGIAHRWGWKHSLVQLLFVVLTFAYGIGLAWYLVEILRTKQKLPTKGVPRPRKA